MSSLEFLVTVNGANATLPRLEFEVQVETPGLVDAEQDFEVTVDSALVDAARPRDITDPASGLCQMVGWEILIDGEVAVTSSDRRGWGVSDWYVDLDMEGSTAGLTIASGESCRLTDAGVVYSRKSNPWGSPYGNAGPVGGKRNITINGLYATASGLQTIPLMTRGIVENSQRRVEDGAVDGINIIDAFGRHQNAPVWIVFPPGHNLTRRQMVLWISQEALVPTHDLFGGTRTLKEVRATTSDWWEVCRQLMEVEGRALHFNTEGHLTNPLLLPKGPAFTGPPEFSFDERDILRGTFTSEHESEVPTRVCAWGTEQLPCSGTRTKTTVRETFGIRERARAFWSYNFDSEAYTAVTGGGDRGAVNELLERVTITQEMDCDTVLSETTCIERWYNPIAARSWVGTKPAIGGSPVVYVFDAESPPPLTAPAYKWAEERFVTVSHVKTTYFYDPLTGVKTGEDETRSGWYNAECSIKERSNITQDWESQPEVFRFIDSGGRPIERLTEVYIGVDCAGTINISPWGTGVSQAYIERSLQTNTTDNGYVSRQETVTTGVRATPGVLYLYNGGEENGSECELWGQKERIVETFEPLGEDSHRRTTVRYDELDQLTDQTAEVQIGYLPIAGSRLSAVPPNTFFDREPGAAGDAVAASRAETQSLLSIVSAPALEVGHAESELQIKDEHSNSLAELNQVGADVLRIAAAQDCEFQLPGNFLIRRATKIHVRLDAAEFNHDVWVTGIRHEQGDPSEPITTTVKAKYFPI